MKTKAALLKLKKWTHGKTVLQQLGITPNERNLRNLRFDAEKSRGHVLSGDKGYIATQHARASEVLEFKARMEHQAAKMCERVRDVLEVYEQTLK